MNAPLLAFDGSPAPEGWGHAGWPVDEADALARVRRGLPVYWPTDPRLVDQRPYLAFSASRGPNTE